MEPHVDLGGSGSSRERKDRCGDEGRRDRRRSNSKGREELFSAAGLEESRATIKMNGIRKMR
jgi:hypothetical protein